MFIHLILAVPLSRNLEKLPPLSNSLLPGSCTVQQLTNAKQCMIGQSQNTNGEEFCKSLND